jgi:ribosomal protein L32
LAVGFLKRDSTRRYERSAGTSDTAAAAMSTADEEFGQIALAKTISGQCQRYRE